MQSPRSAVPSRSSRASSGWSGTSSTRGCRTPTASATGGRWASSPPCRSGPTGVALARARPDLPLGWLFLAVGVVSGISLVATEYGLWGLQRGHSSADNALWWGNWLWVVGLVPIASLVPLLVPDGRLPSPAVATCARARRGRRPGRGPDLRGRSVLLDHARPGHGRAAQPGLGPVDGRARGQRPAHPRHRRGGDHRRRWTRRAVAPLGRGRAAAAQVGPARDRERAALVRPRLRLRAELLGARDGTASCGRPDRCPAPRPGRRGRGDQPIPGVRRPVRPRDRDLRRPGVAGERPAGRGRRG